MKKHLILLLPLVLAACNDPQFKNWVDPGDDKRAALDSMPAPELDGVNGTLERQAIDAMAKGDVARAGQFYEQLLGSDKAGAEDKIRYQLGLAESLRRVGQNEKALDAYDAVLKEKPKNLDAQEGRALTLMAMGKAVDAGRAFSDIMKKDDTRWRTLNALGILFVTKNMVPEANAYFTEALKHSADNPAVLNNVGLSYAVDRNFPRAIAALEQASRVAAAGEKRKQIDLNLAMVYGVSGDLDTAREVASRYLEGPPLQNNLGLYAHLAKDDALAKTYLNMALTDATSYYERAWKNLDIVEKTGDPRIKK